MDTKALRQFSYGVYLLTTRDTDGRKVGCVVNTGMQLTSRPYRVMVAVNLENATCEAIRRSGSFALSCLSTKADMGLVGTFGFHSSKDTDKFAGLDVRQTAQGVPYVADASCSVVGCRVVDSLEVGTHVIFVGEVEDAEVLDAGAEPMTYAYYHNTLRGTTPPKASAFIADEQAEPSAAGQPGDQGTADGEQSDGEAPATLHHFRCNLCGYVYETTDEELPGDFRCPMCGAAADMFTKID